MAKSDSELWLKIAEGQAEMLAEGNVLEMGLCCAVTRLHRIASPSRRRRMHRELELFRPKSANSYFDVWWHRDDPSRILAALFLSELTK